MTTRWALLSLHATVTAFAVFVVFCAVAAASPGPSSSSAATGHAERAHVLLRTGVAFVPNAGRHDARVAFSAATFAGTLFVTREGELVYTLPPASVVDPRGWQTHLRWSLTERFVAGVPRPAPGARAVTRVSHFDSNRVTGASQSLPTYAEISLGEVWPGVDVRLSRTGPDVEKIYTLAPGISPSRIRMDVAGAERLSVAAGGELIVATMGGPVSFTAPVAYQDIDGERRPVDVAYDVAGSSYGFKVGTYDAAQPLVIDPFLQSTYVPSVGVVPSGSRLSGIKDLDLDPATGDLYLLATLEAGAAFPGTTGGAQPVNNNAPGTHFETVVARFDAELTTLIQATYYGGSFSDVAKAMAVTPQGVYVLGTTSSPSLPGLAGGALTTAGDGFVVRFSRSLTAIIQATFLDTKSGSFLAQYWDLLVHPSGDVYITGAVSSALLDNTGGSLQPVKTNAPNQLDAFVIRLDGTLATWIRSTYLGGTGRDEAFALAVDEATGDIYVAGKTRSADFPGTSGGALPIHSGGGAGFVARISADLSTLKQSTYVYGSPSCSTCAGDDLFGVLAHPLNGDIYVAGDGTAGMPATAGAAQPAPLGGSGMAPYVARLNPALTAFVRTTYFGGADGQGVKNSSGGPMTHPLRAHPVTGELYLAGNNFTRVSPLIDYAGGAQSTQRGEGDAFITRFNAALTSRGQATLVGGSGGFDYPFVLMIHPRSGDVYLAGGTDSPAMPGTAGGYLPTKPTVSGFGDGFVVRVSADLAAASADCSTFTDVAGNSPFCANVEWLKNRDVTLGCAAGLYCAVNDVTRLAMAAFMNRLGTALTPIVIKREAQPGAVALTPASVACETSDYAVAKFPRRAYLDGVFMGQAANQTEFGADLVATLDNGDTWIDVGVPGHATVAANQWANVRAIGSLDLWVGETVRFAFRVTPGGGAGGGALTDSRCTIRAIVRSRSVVNSPF